MSAVGEKRILGKSVKDIKKTVIAMSPKRNPIHATNISNDAENARPSGNVQFTLPIDTKTTKSNITAPESAKKKRKAKKKSTPSTATVANPAGLVEDSGAEQLSTVARAIKAQNEKFASVDSDSEKEKVLCALRSFIKVMDSHKRKFLALPPGPPPRSNKKNARFYPGAESQNQPLSGKKRGRDAVAGCASFVIPHSSTKAAEPENVPISFEAEVNTLEPSLDAVAANLFAEVTEEPKMANDVVEAPAPMAIEQPVSEPVAQVADTASVQLLGMSPNSFLRNRPSLCSPITNGLRFSARNSSCDVADCSPASICLDGPSDEGRTSTHPITIEMFQSFEHTWDCDGFEDSTVTATDTSVSVSADEGSESRRETFCNKRIRRNVVSGIDGSSPFHSKDVSIKKFDVKADYVEFAVQTEKRGQVRELRKRYSDFEQLHGFISSLIERIDPLPPKQRFPFWGRWKNASFLDSRKNGLENWLKSVLGQLEATISTDEQDSGKAVEAFVAVRDFLSNQLQKN